MIYYLLLITIFTIGIFLAYDGKYFCFRKNRKLYLISFSIVCILIMGLRSTEVGVDTKNYKLCYDIIASADWIDVITENTGLSMEVGYLCWMKLFSTLGFDYYFFQMVNAIIYISGMTLFMKRNNSNVFYCSFVFLGMGLFLESFNISRQMMAVMFAVNGWWNINNNHKYKGGLLWGIACCIHRVSIVFILINVIAIFRKNKWFIRSAAIASFFVIPNYEWFLSFFIKYMPVYSNYYKNVKVIHEAGFVWGLWIVILGLAMYNIFKINSTSSEEYIISIFSALYVIFNIIGLKLNYAERVGLFFLPYIVILFERFGINIKSRLMRCWYYCLSLVCFVIYFILSAQNAQYVYSSFLK